MPLDFTVKMEFKAGPFHLKGEGPYTCREFMLGLPAYLISYKWEEEAYKKFPNIQNDLNWYYGRERTGDCRYVPYLMYENEITDVTCTLWVRSHFALDKINKLGSVIADRYRDVLFDSIKMRDGFTNHVYPGAMFYSTSINAVGALWWMVLADRIIFRSSSEQLSANNTMSDLIKYSDIDDDYIWDAGDMDRKAHLNLWDNPHNEIPVTDWIISGSGPCLGECWANSTRSDASPKADFIRQRYNISK